MPTAKRSAGATTHCFFGRTPAKTADTFMLITGSKMNEYTLYSFWFEWIFILNIQKSSKKSGSRCHFILNLASFFLRLAKYRFSLYFVSAPPPYPYICCCKCRGIHRAIALFSLCRRQGQREKGRFVNSWGKENLTKVAKKARKSRLLII